jgi:uncharacterized protein (DUF983 family)
MQSRQLLRFSRQLLGRALRLRCPRCGEGKIFRRLLTYSEHTSCPRCGLRYDPRGESLAFMYVSTAFLTGVMVVVMLLMHPESIASGRMVVIPIALALYVSTLPVRKALAIALNYLNHPALWRYCSSAQAGEPWRSVPRSDPTNFSRAARDASSAAARSTA